MCFLLGDKHSHSTERGRASGSTHPREARSPPTAARNLLRDTLRSFRSSLGEESSSSSADKIVEVGKIGFYQWSSGLEFCSALREEFLIFGPKVNVDDHKRD